MKNHLTHQLLQPDYMGIKKRGRCKLIYRSPSKEGGSGEGRLKSSLGTTPRMNPVGKDVIILDILETNNEKPSSGG